MTGVIEEVKPSTYKICCKPGKTNTDRGNGKFYQVPHNKVEINEPIIPDDKIEIMKRYFILCLIGLDDKDKYIDILESHLLSGMRGSASELYKKYINELKRYYKKQDVRQRQRSTPSSGTWRWMAENE